jgi:Ca2+-binding EF-hand superfamily protein
MSGETELTDLSDVSTWRAEFDAMDIDRGGTIDCGELMSFMKVWNNNTPAAYLPFCNGRVCPPT